MNLKKTSEGFIVLPVCWLSWMWNHGTRVAVPVLAPYLTEKYSLTVFEAAVLSGITYLSFYGFMIVSGQAVVRIGYKRSVALSTLGASLLFAFAGYAPNTLMLFLLLFLTGFSLSLYLPAAIPWLSGLFNSSKRGLVVGIHESAAPTGQTLGPVFVAVAAALLALEQVFVAWAVIATLAGVLIILLAKPTPSMVVQAARDAQLMSIKRLGIIIIVTLGVLIGNLGVLPLIPIYLVNVFGLERGFVATLVGLSRLLGLIGQPVGGYLSDRFGRLTLITILTILTFLSTAYIAYAPFNILYIVFLVIQATATAMYFPVVYALISEEARAYASIQIGRLLFVSGLLGPTLTAFVMGYLAETFSYTIAFTYPLIFTLLSVVAVPWLRKAPHK